MREFPKESISRLKNGLRAHRDSPNPAVRWSIRGIAAAHSHLVEAVNVANDPERRSILLTRLLDGSRLHQGAGNTAMDRFPEIFAACREFFGGRSDLNLLSFGCSTGEEVLTLRHYFPTASITGAEINGRSLALCRKRTVDGRMSFVRPDRGTLRRRGPYDAIFCMAVLQRIPLKKVNGEFPASLKNIYPFERFDEQITEFDQLLKKGGLLVVHAKAYALHHASVAANYKLLANAPKPTPDGIKYDRDSRRTADSWGLGSIFVKTK